MSNVLHIQQWDATQSIEVTTCPQADPHPADVGAGAFRLQITTADGDVLDTTDEVTL